MAETIIQQFKSILSNKKNGFVLSLVKDNPFIWHITFFGPENSPYEGGTYPSIMEFPPQYPSEPPIVHFTCPMYHPNVSDPYGVVCLPILRLPEGNNSSEFEIYGMWNPSVHPETIIYSIVSMLAEPDFDQPENIDAAKTWQNDKREFTRKVKRLLYEFEH